ncbi:hypothetical protein BaRGS_00020292 [Batillaria attramentaria]|uniref:Uncharacterized protein n=1 Tax=Batillaria attramentaria TaxID=370345 RepID=A0ABD0KMV8_9CAEN
MSACLGTTKPKSVSADDLTDSLVRPSLYTSWHGIVRCWLPTGRDVTPPGVPEATPSDVAVITTARHSADEEVINCSPLSRPVIVKYSLETTFILF